MKIQAITPTYNVFKGNSNPTSLKPYIADDVQNLKLSDIEKHTKTTKAKQNRTAIIAISALTTAFGIYVAAKKGVFKKLFQHQQPLPKLENPTSPHTTPPIEKPISIEISTPTSSPTQTPAPPISKHTPEEIIPKEIIPKQTTKELSELSEEEIEHAQYVLGKANNVYQHAVQLLTKIRERITLAEYDEFKDVYEKTGLFKKSLKRTFRPESSTETQMLEYDRNGQLYRKTIFDAKTLDIKTVETTFNRQGSNKTNLITLGQNNYLTYASGYRELSNGGKEIEHEYIFAKDKLRSFAKDYKYNEKDGLSIGEIITYLSDGTVGTYTK